MGVTNHKKALNEFSGNMATDFDVRTLRSPDYYYALNMRNGSGTKKGGSKNAIGNTAYSYHTLPAGTNKCIGTYEDVLENSFIEFIWNSNGNHRIVRTYPNIGYGEVIASGSELNFNQYYYIHSVSLVDRKFLYWTDAWEDDANRTLQGNPLRKLNVQKAAIYNKSFEYKWCFAQEIQFNYSAISGQSVTITGTASQTITFTPTSVLSRQSFIRFIHDQINAGVNFVARFDGEALIIRSVNNQEALTITGAGVSNWGLIVPYNFFTINGATSAVHFSWAKPQPQFSPVIEFQNNINNPVKRTPTQYCVRYIYDDGEISAWGEYSRMEYNSITAGFQTLIDFYDPRLNNVNYLSVIKAVEIGVRYGNTQSVQSIVIIDTVDVGFATLPKTLMTPTVNSNFYINNANIYGKQVGSDDNTPDNTVQVLKPYDFIPELAHTITCVSDENGATMAMVSNNVRGKDNVKTNTSVTITEISITGGLIPERVTLKPKGRYNWGIVYYDENGTSGAVNPCNSFITTDKLMQTEILLNINHRPPTWAKTYQIVRTKEQSISSYRTYTGVVRTIGFSETTWKLKETHANTPDSSTSIKVYFDQKFKADFSLASKGDRLRAWQEDNTVSADEAILGYQIDANGDTYFITAGGTGLFDYVEVYSSNSQEEQFYYGTGLKFPITNGFHEANNQNQTALLPAIVEFIGGDTKWDTGAERYSQVYYPEQSQRIINDSLGRPNIVDINAKRAWYRHEVRFSNTYIPESAINGLSSFRGTDYINLDYDFGSIQKLELSQRSLVAVCQHKTQSIYVNRDRLLDFGSNQSIGRTDRILNIAQATVNNWGTRNPESVRNVDGRIYAWDSYNGLFWRFAQDGQQDITGDNKIEFKRIGRSRMIINRLTDKVISGHEDEYNMIYFSFSSDGNGQYTIGIEELTETAGVKGYFSFLPDYMVSVGGIFVTYKNGFSYRHGSPTPTYCNFYGTQYNAEIVAAVNEDAKAEKQPTNFRLQATNYFICPLIEIPSRKGYPDGQKSRILQKAKWALREGQYRASVLKDYTDNAKQFTDIVDLPTRQSTALLKGRDLKMEGMFVTLRAFDPSVENELFLLTTEYFDSQNTD